MMSKRHILVVDDDEALRSGVCDLLELSDFDVSSAIDGADALKKLDELPHTPDLIVSDIRMPNMDGYSFLEAVRKRPDWLSIPFIFLSAKGDKEDIRRGKLRGADDYVPKPFDFEDLIVAIQASLARRDELNALQEARMSTLKQRILHVVNHEFRTPLSYIVAYSDLMANSPSFQHSDELRAYINGIMLGSERLSRLIESFLVLAELESGLGAKIFEYRRARIDNLDTILSGVLDGLEPRATARGVTLKREIEKPVPAFEGDVAYLELALRHLVENGIKFSPENKSASVVVGLKSEPGWLAISVCDSGPGIRQEEREHLFDIFYQVNRDQLEQQGIGAGLAILKHVVDLHGGQIKIGDNAGGGACMTLRLPVEAAAG